MNYYYPYPPYGAGPSPANPYWRYQAANPMGANQNSANLVPPYPAGSEITNQTPTNPSQVPSDAAQPGMYKSIGGFDLPVGNILSNAQGSEYVSNILRLNRGKLATIYMTFSGNDAAIAKKTFVGILEAAGKDHIILSDPNNGHRFVLLMVYLDYIEFPGEINYYYPMENTINIADPDLFEKFPALGALYNYQKQQQDLYKEQHPYYHQLPEDWNKPSYNTSNNNQNSEKY